MGHLKMNWKTTDNISKMSQEKLMIFYEAVNLALSDMEVIARDLCPVDTGKLKETIRSEVDIVGKKVVAQLLEGNEEIDYGVYVEYGTEFQLPQPHFRPAIERYRELLQHYIRELNEKYGNH